MTPEDIRIKMEKFDPYCIDKIRKLEGSEFDREEKCWKTDLVNKQILDELFSNSFYEYYVSKQN